MRKANVLARHSASSRTRRSSTSAPATRSDGAVYSSTLWLIPPTLGTKIMQDGQTAAMTCASCPSGTAGQASDRKAELTGDCFDTLNQPWRECDRRKAGVGERKHMAGNVDAKQTLLSYYWSRAQIFVS